MPDPTNGPGNSLHRVANYPCYGSGEGGWRDQLVDAGNLRAAEGPKLGNKPFFRWLVSQRDGLPARFLKEL